MLMESGMGCCCRDDRDILKALNKAQADRIETLEKELIARKEQGQIDLAIKKDLDKKLDKATADYRALWVENDNLNRTLARLQSQLDSEKSQSEEKLKNAAKSYARLATERNNLAETVSNMDKTIRDLAVRNENLRERLAQTNASLKRSVQKESDLQSKIDFIEAVMEKQAKEIERLRTIANTSNGSCSAYAQQGMQSKIAKQANEIKRLAEENERLSGKNDELSGRYAAQNVNVAFAMDEIKRLTEENKQLHNALDIAAKDADANFERGKIKGMEEIWQELRDCYYSRPTAENEKIFGYLTVGEIVGNLSPTWFMNKAEEHHKQGEQQAKNVQIGDEVQCFDLFCPDDDPHSDIGIVVAVDSDGHSFIVVGPKFEGSFDTTDIQFGTVKKTGRHFDSIPLDYFA